jgi:hypothetical protein
MFVGMDVHRNCTQVCVILLLEACAGARRRQGRSSSRALARSGRSTVTPTASRRESVTRS